MGKKIGSLILLLILLLNMSAFALAAGMVLTVEAPALPSVGQTFTVRVTITGNPGLCAAQYTLAFDSGVVDCESMKLGSALGGMLSATNPDGASGAILAAAATDAKTGDGVLAEYTFRVLKSGNPAFALTDGVFTNGSGSPVATDVPAPVQSQTEPQGWTPAEPKKPDAGKEPISGGEPAQESSDVQTFPDVPTTFWGYDSIQKAVALNLITGNPDGTFRPNDNMTRAEFVTLLYRIAGSPEADVSSDFQDVRPDAWYAKAVSWAFSNGYIEGDGKNFYPAEIISRQQMVTLLYRYDGGSGGMEMMLSAFGVDNLAAYSDKGEIASWAEDAMRWAVFSGLISGTSAATLSPTGSAQRAQVTAFFVHYLEKQST